jgi:hypothetical protein
MPLPTLARDPSAAIWQRVLRFQDDPSPAVARAFLKMQFADSDKKRMSELSAKARAGTLTAEEERQAEAYEQLGCLLDILHSQARRALKRGKKAS